MKAMKRWRSVVLEAGLVCATSVRGQGQAVVPASNAVETIESSALRVEVKTNPYSFLVLEKSSEEVQARGDGRDKVYDERLHSAGSYGCISRKRLVESNVAAGGDFGAGAGELLVCETGSVTGAVVVQQRNSGGNAGRVCRSGRACVRNLGDAVWRKHTPPGRCELFECAGAVLCDVEKIRRVRGDGGKREICRGCGRQDEFFRFSIRN
jgi:hypothetical protein